MTNEQILKKAIERAVKNNWDKTDLYWFNNKGEKTWNPVLENDDAYKLFIFDHDFAKAVFGDKNCSAQEDESKMWHDTSCCSACGCFFEGKEWQYHLQQMVLLTDKERFKYLEKFLGA